MTLITNFVEFENSVLLEDKIDPVVLEGYLNLFPGEINEGGIIDNITNKLSKAFLGSLSYISMIDKIRSEVLKIERDLVSKKYSHQEEVRDLNTQIKTVSKTGSQSGIDKIRQTIDSKENEYQTYVKLAKAALDKFETTLEGIIKGNKRRTEYWEEGRAKDEVELLKFEHQLAKKKSSEDSEAIKKIEKEIQEAEEEARKKSENLKQKEEEENKKKKEKEKKKEEEERGVASLDSPTPDYNKALKSKEGRRKLILMLKHKIVELEDKAERSKGYSKGETERTIKKLKGDLAELKKIHEKLSSKRVATDQQEFQKNQQAIVRMGNELTNLHSRMNRTAGSQAEEKNKTAEVPSGGGNKTPGTSQMSKAPNRKSTRKSPPKRNTSKIASKKK